MAYQTEPDVDLLEGAVFGAGAYVVGVLITLIATVARSTPVAANVPVRETSASAATIVDYGGFTGYLPLAALATVIVGVGIDEIQLVSADSVLTLLAAGVVYPVVFGGLGGLLSKYP